MTCFVTVAPEGQGYRQGQNRGSRRHGKPAVRRYSAGKGAKELATILGERLTPTDLLFAKFADEFERRYVSQSYDDNRTIETTLDLGWELLSILPKAELKRIRTEYIDKYLPSKKA